MNTHQLKSFITIVEAGSFSKAENIEYISKQALMKQINTLENEIGVPLLNRSSLGIECTDAGNEFYKGAKEILKLEQELIFRCQNNLPKKEVLRLSQVEHQALLHQVTDAFVLKYPDIKIQKVIHPNHSGEFRVENDIIDIGETFYTEKTALGTVVYQGLKDYPYILAMRKDHPLANFNPISLHQCKTYPILFFEQMLKKEYLELLEKSTTNLIRRTDVDNQVSVAFECSNSDTLFLTANPFIYEIPNLITIPLQESWVQEYGILYRQNPSSTLLKYIDLAKQIFAK